eukprot:GHVU01174551.1.p1 GENE.GHVU01174551.1~~GHVU01174551.1.p1  ORF type:complete len:151 (+),score=17.37 GHVU01174551.1:32-484(+)
MLNVGSQVPAAGVSGQLSFRQIPSNDGIESVLDMTETDVRGAADGVLRGALEPGNLDLGTCTFNEQIITVLLALGISNDNSPSPADFDTIPRVNSSPQAAPAAPVTAAAAPLPSTSAVGATVVNYPHRLQIVRRSRPHRRMQSVAPPKLE